MSGHQLTPEEITLINLQPNSIIASDWAISKTLSITTLYKVSYIMNLDKKQLQALETMFSLTPGDPRNKTRILRICRFARILEVDQPLCTPIWSAGQKFRLTDLFCYKLAHHTCTGISQKIANSFIKISSSRIFDDATRAINEIIVNGLDAIQAKYGYSSQVGKFGMGFFSLFWWTYTYGGKVTISSSYLGYDGHYCTSMTELWFENSDLIGTINTYSQPQTATGTMIDIQITNGSFPVKKIIDKIMNLQYQTTAQIHVRTMKNSFTIGTGSDIIDVLFSSTGSSFNEHYNRITVSDTGIGMDIYTLQNYLLIPTISTKQIQSYDYIPSVSKFTGIVTEKAVSGGSSINILVGSVITISIPLSIVDSKSPISINIGLSVATKVPVTRDTVVFSDPLVERELTMAFGSSSHRTVYGSSIRWICTFGCCSSID